MKKIEMIIDPSQLGEIKERLAAVGIERLTVSDVKRFDNRQVQPAIYRGARYTIDSQRKLKVEITLPDQQAATVLDSVVQSARTGRCGDFEIWVMALEEAIHVPRANQFPMAA